MSLDKNIITCSYCNNDTECCSCVCAYCGQLDDCNCPCDKFIKIPDTLKYKNQFKEKERNFTHDDDYEFIQKWQIGRSRFP